MYIQTKLTIHIEDKLVKLKKKQYFVNFTKNTLFLKYCIPQKYIKTRLTNHIED